MSKEQSRTLLLVGVVASVAWIGLALGWTFRGGNVPNLAANEWGDWAAGVAAPLAFFWLVLGYLQQGAEINLNTQELARSVDAQNRLVVAAQAQADASRLAASSNAYAIISTFQPVITLLNQGFDGGRINVNLRNDGRLCYRVTPKIEGLDGDFSTDPPVLTAWAPGSNQGFSFNVPGEDVQFKVVFSYLDALGKPQSVTFQCSRRRRNAMLTVSEFYPEPFVPKLGGDEIKFG